jgi:two-component sensor histidine kinase
MFPVDPYVKIEKKLDSIILNARLLFSLGIIVNELLTNAFKYAFKPGETGIVQVTAELQGDHVAVKVLDSGGRYPDDPGAAPSVGFGLQVVQLMTKQMGANFKIQTIGSDKKATLAELTFPRG